MAIDQELKQRLVGAAVITAIAAIFVPMLFDDPVVKRGKTVNEFSIPDPPHVLKPEAASITSPDSGTGDSVAENAPMSMEMTPDELAAEAAADKSAAERLAQELAEAERKEKQLTESQIAGKDKLKESAIEKKALQRAALKQGVTNKNAQQDAIERKKAKEQAALEKQAAEKLAQRQAEEYRKLAAKKAKEQALLEKKAAEKAALEAKRAAKQQAIDDKAAMAKIAADKQAVEKAATDRSNGDTPSPSRWYIRMGSFSKKSNATALRDKLRKQGFPAVIDLIKTADKGNLYRLRVGPDLSKERAEKIRQKLDAENHSNSILELE